MTRDAALLGRLTIPGRPENVRRARSFVTDLLGDRRVDPDTAALLTSELVTNALLHTASGGESGTVVVTVVEEPDGIVITVLDDGSPDGVPVVGDQPDAAHGHGLLLVEQLAARWGFVREGPRTAVWFRMSTVPAGAGATRPNRCASYPPGPVHACTAAATAAQIVASSSSPVTYGGMV